MSLRNLNEWTVIVKEAFNGSFLVTKAFCFVHVTKTYVFTVASLNGPSMLPIFSISGDLALVEKISHRLGKIDFGDIVLVTSPAEPKKIMTKRVIGVEGDSVTYVIDPKNSDRTETIVVLKGHIWVEGDNIYKSKDSTNFGAVSYGLLQGKMFWKVWPPKDFGPLGNKEQNS
ncbi:PREDICTED: mitochondrial inner membrane protease subunit 1-like [Populus euphratica]|uniref:Mitochondrial inner membrane protease subunit 1-like n=1 Tax=Populus euphratica TaxID=75702 RepID=A0AAJ6XDJ9_POPEU|nr:PREDICTED: mitochondrial inner membrane protease subunit 1-like [Populus euphratica]